MKVVVNARFLTQRITGVQRFAIELSRQLIRIYGNEVGFVAPHNIIQKDIAREFNVKTIGTHAGYFWEQVELPLFLKRNGSPKLLNFCSVAPLFYNNNIIAVHDITWVRFPETYSKKFKVVYNFLIPRLCQTAKNILTVSNFSLQEISDNYHIDKKKFTVVYNAVDEIFHKVEDDSLSKENYFIAVSSVKENKNFQTVIKSFLKLQKKLPNVSLYIVGDLTDKNFKAINIEGYKLNPNIKFLGRVSDDDLIKYYSNALGFIFPSLYEGFGIPVLEAQACGCPVISSNTSSLPEVLQDSALFSSPMDSDSFAENMIRIVSDKELKKTLIERGYWNVKRFSWEVSAKKIACLIEAQNDNVEI